jgi:hypothetical protein
MNLAFRFCLVSMLARSIFGEEISFPLRDSFESNSLALFWLPADYGDGRYVPGAIKISTNYARSGSRSVEVTVHEHDIAQDGGDGRMTERADLDSGHFNLLSQDGWYAFSFLFPTNFPIGNTRLVFGSCKQTDVPRPILAQRFRNGRHTFTIESHHRRKDYTFPKLTLGQWHDMIYHVRYATNETGVVQVWMNGKKVVDYKGPTAETGYRNAFYHKIGLYRDQMKQPMTVYFDDYIFSTNSLTPGP